MAIHGLYIWFVLFSGYNYGEHDKTEFTIRAAIADEIHFLSQEGEKMLESGAFDDNPGLLDDYKDRISSLRAEMRRVEKDRADYFFGKYSDLGTMSPGDPLYYATLDTTEFSTIGVYDPNKLPEHVQAHINYAWNGLPLTPKEVDDAIVIRFYPRFPE